MFEKSVIFAPSQPATLGEFWGLRKQSFFQQTIAKQASSTNQIAHLSSRFETVHPGEVVPAGKVIQLIQRLLEPLLRVPLAGDEFLRDLIV